jgi:hypothetical protein
VADLTDDGSDFGQLLGAFGTHADLNKRAKAERLASMKPDDGRRKRAVTRPHQFNARVSDETMALAKALIERFTARDGRKWSQADLITQLIADAAKREKIKETGA